MSNKLITRYEFQNLKVGDPLRVDGSDFDETFSDRHLKLLRQFHGDRGKFKYYSLTYHGVKFAQYVGILCVGDLMIKVLPKADNQKDGDEHEWENRLLEMLRVVYKLKIHSTSKSANQNISPNRILDIFLTKYLDEVELILHKGLVKTYNRKQENTTALKGKLLISKHIIKNLVHKERFYVEHSVYDYNHHCNQIIRKALITVLDITSNRAILCRASTLLFEFPELGDINVDEGTFSKIRYERRTEEYRDALQIAKLILLNYMPSVSGKKQDRVLSLMFDMNKLWEEYVYRVLKKELRGKYAVYDQKVKTFWKSSNGTKTIRPDITVYKGDKCVAVLDTKWKCPKDSDGRPIDADLKQMYVYHLFWDTQKSALIYPGNKDVVYGSFEKVNKFADVFKCNMVFLSFNDNDKACLDLGRIKDYLEE